MRRGYRLAGFGAMFVLSPRTLPLPAPAPTPEEKEIARFFSEAARELERRLSRVESADVRSQLQQSLKAMRQTEAELRLRERMGSRLTGAAPDGAPAPAPRTLEQQLTDLEHDVQMMQRMQSEAVQALPDDIGIPPEVRREFEAHMRLMNEQAEAFAAEAERARQQAERGIWMPAGSAAALAARGAGASRRPCGRVAAWTGRATGRSHGTGRSALRDVAAVAALDRSHGRPDPGPAGRDPGRGRSRDVGARAARRACASWARRRSVAVAIDFLPATRPTVGSGPRPARTLDGAREEGATSTSGAAGAISPAELPQAEWRLRSGRRSGGRSSRASVTSAERTVGRGEQQERRGRPAQEVVDHEEGAPTPFASTPATQK